MESGIEQGSIWKAVDHALKQLADKISLSEELLRIYESRKDVDVTISPPETAAEELVQIFIDLEDYRSRIKNIEDAHRLEHHQFYSHVVSPVFPSSQDNTLYHM